MKILTTLGNKDVSTTEKLAAVAELVTKVRTKYGNTEIEISAPKVNSTYGHVSISLLTDEEKVAIAEGELRELVSFTTAVVESTEGTMFDRVFEGFVATNGILVNLGATSDSEY